MATATASETSEPALYPKRHVAIAILLMANFMNLVDVTIVNVALPTLHDELGATPNMIEWIIAGYTFAFALFLLPAGRMGDIFGRRRLFLVGVTVFTAASALCGFSPSVEWLVGARLVQGMGGALMAPQTLAIVPALFPPEERGGVYAYFALTAGLASVTGPIVGGLLIGADILGMSWRPIFLVNIPIGIAAFAGALWVVPAIRGKRSLGIDIVGIPLAALTILALLVPLIEIAALGWRWWMGALFVAAPLLGWLFVRWQGRQERVGGPQLLPMRLLRERAFLTGSILAGVLFSAIPGFFLVFAMYVQSGFGLTPLQSGLMTIPFPLGLIAASPISNRLGDRYLRARVICGSVCIALGFLGIRFAIGQMPDTIHWLYTAPFFALAGIGMGNTVSPLFQTALSTVKGDDSGSASGAVQSFQRLGNSFGVALVGGLFFMALGNAAAGDKAAYAEAARTATLYPLAGLLLIAVFALLRPLDRA